MTWGRDVSWVCRVLSITLRDSFDAAGFGFGYTYSSTRPLWRIDYIYASREFTIGECVPLNVRASDHQPLRAVLFLPRSGAGGN